MGLLSMLEKVASCKFFSVTGEIQSEETQKGGVREQSVSNCRRTELRLPVRET